MTVKKPLFRNQQGLLQQLQDGSIVNIGGTTWPGFTIDGIGVLLEDGSSTTGGSISLQTVYNNSIDLSGDASIKLLTGRDLVIYDDTNNSVFFKIDAETGKVTITGDLEVAGSSSIINSVTQDSDHWRISPASSITTSLKIEPEFNSPLVDLVQIKHILGGPLIFRIDKDGNTYLKQLIVSENLSVIGNISVNGTVDGVDISVLQTQHNALSLSVSSLLTDFSNHIDLSPTPKHAAIEISVAPPVYAPTASNVQQVVDALAPLLGGIGAGQRFGYEYTNGSPSVTWTIAHNGGTKRVHVSVYDTADDIVYPDNIKIVDNNHIEITFGIPQDGRAILILF